MRRLAASALLAAGVVLALAAPAVAEPISPLLRYEGQGTVVTESSSGPVDLVATVDCSQDPCVATVIGTADGETIDFTGGGVAIDDGRAVTTLPADGDPCTPGSFRPALDLVAEFDADAAFITIDSQGSAEVDCPDGSAVQWYASHIEGTLPLLTGDSCVLDATCLEPPVAGPTTPTSPSTVEPRAADDPGSLSTLPTVVDAVSPRGILWAAVGSVVLVLLVALPTALLDSVADRLTSGSERRRPLVLHGWPAALGGLAVAGILSAFVDPRLGPDLAGLRTVASVLLSLGIAVALGWLVVLLVSRRTHPTASRALEFRPLTLGIVVVAVLFSRFTGFEPGLVFGLVAGVVLGGVLATADRARFALVGLGWAFAIGLACWIAYSLVPADSDALVFVRETLAAVTVAGFSTLPIALLPVRGLVGRELWDWRKPVWAAAYAVGMAAFLLAVLVAPFAWDAVHASVWAWGALFAAYAVGAVVVWLVVTRPWRGASAGGPSAS